MGYFHFWVDNAKKKTRVEHTESSGGAKSPDGTTVMGQPDNVTSFVILFPCLRHFDVV